MESKSENSEKKAMNGTVRFPPIEVTRLGSKFYMTTDGRLFTAFTSSSTPTSGLKLVELVLMSPTVKLSRHSTIFVAPFQFNLPLATSLKAECLAGDAILPSRIMSAWIREPDVSV